MRPSFPLPLLLLSILPVAPAFAHLIPTVTISSQFDDGSASFELDLDLRLARDGQPAPPSSLLDGPGGEAERDALLALSRAFIDEHLRFLFDEQPIPLDWSLEIYDPQEVGAPAAENQLHVLATANLSPPEGTSSFRLRAGPELPASLILINHRDGVAARRANVLFAGEASRPFAYATAGPATAAPGSPTSAWRPPAVLHGLSLALKPLPALLALAFALTLRGPALLLFPLTFGLGSHLPSPLAARSSLPLPAPDTLLLIALALAALAALLPPISLRPPPGTPSRQPDANALPAPTGVPATILALFIAPALLATLAATPPAPACLATTAAATLTVLALTLIANFSLAPILGTRIHARRILAVTLIFAAFTVYLTS